jgi:DNA-binding transcriptional MocR family regulator
MSCYFFVRPTARIYAIPLGMKTTLKGRTIKWLGAILGGMVLVALVTFGSTSIGSLTFTNTPLLRPDGDSEPEISIAANGTMAMVGLSLGLAPDMQFGTNLWTGPFGTTPTFQGIIDGALHHSAVIDQAILCDFIIEGHFGRHIRRMRELYASRLTVLRESVQRRLGKLLTLPETEAGVNAVGWLGKGLSAEAVARAAAERNVEVIPINRFALKARTPEGLLLGFGAVDERELLRGGGRPGRRH